MMLLSTGNLLCFIIMSKTGEFVNILYKYLHVSIQRNKKLTKRISDVF